MRCTLHALEPVILTGILHRHSIERGIGAHYHHFPLDGHGAAEISTGRPIPGQKLLGHTPRGTAVIRDVNVDRSWRRAVVSGKKEEHTHYE